MPDHTMSDWFFPFHEFEAQANPTMEQLSSPSYQPQFSDIEALNEWYMVPNNSNFLDQLEFPYVPSFAQGFVIDPYWTPQTPKQFNIDFGLSSVERDNLPLSYYPVIDADPLVTPDDGYILYNSPQSIEGPVASPHPSSTGSAPENSTWDFIESGLGESVGDLTALHSDSYNISETSDSEPLISSSTSTPTKSRTELEEASSLLALSLIENFRYPCPYESCNKSFKRKEHAKRHYTTKHESRNHLRCEFCGKDTFNRRDNLNAHRRLHARIRQNSAGVHFVPAALQALQKVQETTRHNGKLVQLRG